MTFFLFSLLLGLPVVPESYKLDIEDKLEIYISGNVSFTYSETISPEGTVFIRSGSGESEQKIERIILGNVKVVGLTLESARKKVQEEFNKYFKNITVSLVITKFRGVVYVSGAVRSPGAYPFFPGQTAMDYIGRAGGVHERANLRKVYVLKSTSGGKKTKIPINKTEVDRYDTIMVEYLPLNLWRDYIGVASTIVGIIVAWLAIAK